MTISEFKQEMERKRAEVDAAIEKYLPSEDTRPSIIHRAMRYSMKVGGKRMRPMLLLASSELFGTKLDPMPACVAIESLHTYSLIHDDLPCMDNSDLRRGFPTCHKQFDETMALLAGDALLTFSMEILVKEYADSPKAAILLVRDLSEAGDSCRMIGGQVEDILGERDGKMTPDKLNFIHDNKTAALITAAITMGMRLSEKALPEGALEKGRKIGRNIGLAFQIIDDILDVESDAATLGKTAGLDAANGKMTYVSLYGVGESRRIASDLTDEAISVAKSLSDKGEFLQQLIRYMQNRIS